MSRGSKYFYITTTLPYINAEPHIGFAKEIINADVIARYQRLLGKKVFFNTGTDEHGQKIYTKAAESGLPIQAYCDQAAGLFSELKELLNLSFDSFTRTTDPHHIMAAQHFWRQCYEKGDIYKKKYKVKYCVGCELEKTESELENGHCPFHPNQDLEEIEEENYFFRFSKYQNQLLELYKKRKEFVLPEFKLNEIKSFVTAGLQDFSISRLKEKMPCGVPVPDDDTQVMYVWFDALVNYISCLGWPDDLKKMKQYWPGLQVCGKDNLRQQAAMWPAMLMSAGLTPADQVLIFGFLTINNQKISKSLGNTVDPKVLVNQYGIDAVRYYLISEIPTFYDGDYSEEKFLLKYNADLANGLGNLVARVSNLLEKNQIELKLKEGSDKKLRKDFMAIMDQYDLSAALSFLWQKIRENDEYLSQNKPWKLEDKTKIKKILAASAQNILNLAILISIFLPQTGEEIRKQFLEKQIRKKDSLFPRIEIK
jgi:methionyl-tRNA synthetase